MKPKATLSIETRKTRMHRKYAGDPDSPNFMPTSPLIERQILPAQVEAELKRICSIALANEQSADDDLAVVAKYMSGKPPQDSKPRKHDKHSSFNFQPPKPHVPELAATSFLTSTNKVPTKIQTQQKRDRQEAAAVVFEPLEPASIRATKQKPSFTNADDEALYEIRTKLDSRPKTSAAACVDYTESISPVHSTRTTSVPSNRTTYSTPFTSAGITPAQTSKRFSQSVPNVTTNLDVQPVDTTALPKFPDDASALDAGQAAQARAWMAEQLARRRRSSSQTPHDASSTKPLREFHSMQALSTSEIARPSSRAGSTRGSIRNSIREYIRPGSSCAASIQDNRSTASTRSRTRQRLSALKSKISNASLRSRGSSRRRPGYDDGEEYFLNPDEVNLDRPLPPLPGLDSYREKPKHIGLMMKNIISPASASNHRRRDTKNIVIDKDGIERVMNADQEKRRQDDLARAVLEKMSTGSIGSVPGSPTGVITVYREDLRNSTSGSGIANANANLESGGGSERVSRPITAGSGAGVGGVPLHQSYQASAAKQRRPQGLEPPSQSGGTRPVGGFVRKWSGRLGWGRKPRPLAIS